MRRTTAKQHIGALLASAAILLPCSAMGQTAASEDPTDEIVVTARKREETAISVPVLISALSSAEIERRGIISLDTLTRTIPQVLIGDALGGIQGGTVAIRGISTGEQNPFADQAVSFNIDGTMIARSSPRRMAQMDIAQIEVLKGPQALFFGKNSPGGIISIRTADPTSQFEAKVSAAYEINAQEWRGEGYVSGPITDTLGVRLAFFGSTMRGWSKNIVADNPPYTPIYDLWGPGTDEYAGRLTLKFDPSDRFSLRVKASYAHLRDNGGGSVTERIYCPLGVPQLSAADAIDGCRADHLFIRGDFPSGIDALVSDRDNPAGRGAPFGTHPYSTQEQFLASGEANYKLTDALTLSSLTSYYSSDFQTADNFALSASQPLMGLSSSRLVLKEFSQELRLASDWDGPINFLFGGYYQHTDLKNNVRSALAGSGLPAGALGTPLPSPFVSRINGTAQTGDAYSVFGQVRWNILDQLELAGGGRYSHETKQLLGFDKYIDQNVPDSTGTWNNFSPEVTLTWRPTDRLTVFGAYKQGFLSGGFNAGVALFNASRKFDQTLVKGFEGGVKARIGNVRVNFGAYTYDITGLQVSTIIVIPALGTTNQVVTNAGGARTRGVEADFTWYTPVEGLSVRGAAGYNEARYNQFITTCYPGQTQALGCNLIPSATGPVAVGAGQTATLQNLSGFQLVRAPAWNVTGGFTFDRPVSAQWSVGLSGDAFYSSGFWTSASAGPGTYQPSYWTLDATARFYSKALGVEFAVIGKNLTNELYVTRASEVLFSGTTAGTTGPSTTGDVFAGVARGREIMFRVSKTF